jgi:hypothetical protein
MITGPFFMFQDERSTLVFVSEASSIAQQRTRQQNVPGAVYLATYGR